MSIRKTGTPTTILTKSLSDRPSGVRCVLVCDPDRLIEWSRTITDAKGRTWTVIIYRGDDIVARREWQRAWAVGQQICLVLCRTEDDESVLDVSCITDLISRAEGDIIDLSVRGYFHKLFPRVNPPAQTLRQYHCMFVEYAEDIVKVYPRMKERWGEPDSWTRGQFLALLLMARFPELSLDDVWCNEVESVRFAAHAVWLLTYSGFQVSDLGLVADLIWESSHFDRSAETVNWLDMMPTYLEVFRDEIAGYLVLQNLLTPGNPTHLDTLLRARLGITSFDPELLGKQAERMVSILKDDSRWSTLESRSCEFLSPNRLVKVADLLVADAGAVEAMVTSIDTPPNILGFLVGQVILDRFRGIAEWPSWIENLGNHKLLQTNAVLTGPDRMCAALLGAACHLCWAEKKLQTVTPIFRSAEELLDWYITNAFHLLEYRVACAFANLELVDDADLHALGFSFIMKPPDGLRSRVRRFLDALDCLLAVFIEKDLHKFLYGPRSAVRIIPEQLRSGKGRSAKRVWILVMDGMRYDTWDAVVRPLLMQHFEVVDRLDQSYFSLLPSTTDIARRGLLAAKLPKDWKNFFGKPTRDERILVAAAMGLTNQDLDRRIAFVNDAQTTEARRKLGYDLGEARDVNVLIYPISDDLGHYHNDTLASLNQKIRQELLTQQGQRGIIDDLRRRVQTGDIVLVTSDHGFQELFEECKITVTRLQIMNSHAREEDVTYRYLKFRPSSFPVPQNAILIEQEENGADGRKHKTDLTLAVGSAWFQREAGRSTRFAHGGVSLAEMCIPGALLRPIEKKAARIEFLDLPSEIVVQEDESSTFMFELVNAGNVDASFELVASTNTGEVVLEEHGTITPGRTKAFSCRIIGRYNLNSHRDIVPDRTTMAIILDLAHSDLLGKMQHPGYGRQNVRVSVKPRATKIDTEALSAFDQV